MIECRLTILVEARDNIQQHRYSIECNTEHYNKGRSDTERYHDDRYYGQDQTVSMHKQLDSIGQWQAVFLGTAQVDGWQDTHDKEHWTEIQTENHPGL